MFGGSQTDCRFRWLPRNRDLAPCVGGAGLVTAEYLFDGQFEDIGDLEGER